MSDHARQIALHEQNVYRPDIDGLRAVAVLAVVVFHAGVTGLPGGFVGVDVFFVISGYLIGGQIFRQARHGTFTYADFYARRVRRILPALFALLAAMFLVGAAVMTPLELRELGKEAVAAILAASNVLFYSGGGYFAPAAAFDPLLMTWSLGVEEQFYIVFPVIIFLILRLKWPPLLTVSLLSLVSFAASLLLTRLDQQAAFYLLPTRSWELGIGAVLALWEQHNPDSNPRGQKIEILAAGAALALAASLVLYRPAFVFPGLYALWPVLATTILIATRTAWVNRVLLSNPAAVFIGKVSYSFYLWHWPLIYFNRILWDEGAGLPPLALILGSFVMAVLSWKFVEQPFRKRSLQTSRLLWVYAGLALLLALPALGFYRSGGWLGRLPSSAQAFAESARAARENPCLAPYGAVSLQRADICLPESGKDRVLVLGDSHASALAPGLRALALRDGLEFGEATKSSCPPLWGAAFRQEARPRHFAECMEFQNRAFAYVASHPDVKTVVLAGYWSTDLMLTDGQREIPLSEALDTTIAKLNKLGRQVVLIQDVPTFAFDPYARVVGDGMPVRRALSRMWQPGHETLVAAPIPDPSRPVLQAAAQSHPGTRLFDPMQVLCGSAGCRYRGADALYYSDFEHLTGPGAQQAVRGFNPR